VLFVAAAVIDCMSAADIASKQADILLAYSMTALKYNRTESDTSLSPMMMQINTG